jgi:hypothetical protein
VTTQWVQRWPVLCVTAVVGSDRAAALAAIGADGPGDDVRCVGVGAGDVLVETGSVEGIRREVLARASVSGRALSWAKLGDGTVLIGYAEAGEVVAVFEPPSTGPRDPGWPGLIAVAARLGLEPAALVVVEGGGLAGRLFAAGMGVELSERLLTDPAVTALILPVLPAAPDALALPVRTAEDARLAALLRQAPRARLARAVSAVATRVVAANGLARCAPLVDAVRRGGPVADESEAGRLLRVMIAGRDPWSAGRQQPARALVAALNAPPDVAIMMMAGSAPEVPVATVVLDELADVEVSHVDPVPDAPMVLPLTPGMLPPPGFGVVRPDGYVAWRSTTPPATSHLLASALRTAAGHRPSLDSAG